MPKKHRRQRNDVPKFQSTTHFRSIVEDAHDDDLTLWCDQLQDNIAELSSILARARSKLATDGEYADAGWYRRRDDALKYLRKQENMIREEIGLRRREDRREAAHRFERHFIDAARKQLDNPIFMQIMLEAQAASKQEEETNG